MFDFPLMLAFFPKPVCQGLMYSSVTSPESGGGGAGYVVCQGPRQTNHDGSRVSTFAIMPCRTTLKSLCFSPKVLVKYSWTSTASSFSRSPDPVKSVSK